MNTTNISMIQALIECPLDEIATWAEENTQQLNFAFLEQCKEVSDGALQADPNRADALTERMVWLAQNAIFNEPLAEPLAAWARGNWACFHDPRTSLQLYKTAIEGYATPQTSIETARILTNMIAVSLMCARFQDALDAYQTAYPVLANLTGSNRAYLLSFKQNQGALLHYLGRYEEAIDACENAKNLAKELERMDSWSEIQVNQAYTMAMLGQFNRCEGLLLESHKIAFDNDSLLTTARIDLNLGILYTAQGKLADALRVFQRARQGFSNLQNSMDQGSVLLYEAHLLERMGAWREARQNYAQARSYFAELGMQFEVGISAVREGAVNRRYGEYKQAEQLLNKALDIWMTLGHTRWQMQTRLERAALFLASDQSEKALSVLENYDESTLSPALAAEYHALYAETKTRQMKQTKDPILFQSTYRDYKRLLNYSREHGERYMERRALAGLGQIMQHHDRGLAYEFLEKAVDLDRQMRQALSVQELKASFQNQTSELLPLLAKMSMEDGKPEQVLSYIWRAKGDCLLDLFQSASEEFLPSPQNHLVAEIEYARQELASHRWQVLREATSDMPEDVLQNSHNEIRRLEEQLYALRRQRNQASFVESSQLALKIDINRILQNIESEVLIEYLRCGDEIIAVRVDLPQSVLERPKYQATSLVDVETLLDLADELELSMRPILGMTPEKRAQQLSYQLSECHPLLGQLYEYLIVPLGELPANAKLLIAPDCVLHSLPFAAFWDGECYLTERHLLEIIPTAILMSRAQPPVATNPSLVIGASAEGHLPAIQDETKQIHDLLPDSKLFMDEPNSVDYLANLAAAPRLLHLACHTVQHHETELFTALQLAKEFLSVEQCYELSLQGTELVTLSGCTTNAGMDSSGSVLAFQSALFVAGAQQVVSTLWPINDDAACRWMTTFYTYLASGERPSLALQRTQQALLTDPAYGHPAIWAAFVCSRQ